MKLIQIESLLILTLILILGMLTRAQFFTKTSKSIPRMGRRADNLISDQSDQLNYIDSNGDGSNETPHGLRAFWSGIPKFFEDNVLSYRRKLKKRS
ncbi:hypothetical protein BLOT_001706 [Blomia tropicalis]|nr:hypothetical protein BLOT_001706 [Blomia tropicalis]